MPRHALPSRLLLSLARLLNVGVVHPRGDDDTASLYLAGADGTIRWLHGSAAAGRVDVLVNNPDGTLDRIEAVPEAAAVAWFVTGNTDYLTESGAL